MTQPRVAKVKSVVDHSILVTKADSHPAVVIFKNFEGYLLRLKPLLLKGRLHYREVIDIATYIIR